MNPTETELRRKTTADLLGERDWLRGVVATRGWEWARFRLAIVTRVLDAR